MSKYAKLFKAEQDIVSDEARSGNLNEGPSAKHERFTLLFVDDEDKVLKALQRIFFEENYKILAAASAEEALQIMEKEHVQLIVSDHRMPGMTGAQLLQEIKKKWPETIRIMLTGYADIQSIMGAVNNGAVYKFITKPWNDDDLRLTVSLALQQYVLLHENRKLKEITMAQQQKIKNFSAMSSENQGSLGNMLINSGVIKKSDLDNCLKEKENGEFLTETLVRLGLVSETKIIKTLQEQLNIDYLDLREMTLNSSIVRFLPREFCERNRLMPVRLDDKKITIAMADPSDIFKCDNIAFMTGLKVAPVVASASSILSQIKKEYGDRDTEDYEGVDEAALMDPLDEIDIVIDADEGDVNLKELIGSSEIPPIIRIVNAVISEAIRYKASDIHIEPKTKYTIIRFRIDGMLHAKIKIPSDIHLATISRIKILSKMDIAERRKPQDGRITVKSGARMVDIRVSTMPTINGEKVVMRILDKSAAIKALDELGITGSNLRNINTLIKKPQGIVISTGPTGSGKTTMLYSLLNTMMENTKNFETIEDPVEYFLEGANQIYVMDKIGLSFASVLRSTMRQDPDVILVGEIRDYDTADVAFKAALTGHMVLTTLHTNNSVASITRLIDLGVKPYLIASALEGIIAQRLVRKVCKYCKTEVTPDNAMMELLKISPDSLGKKVFYGKGCDRCNNTGYLGRTGIFEVFVMNDDFRHIISSNYKEAELMNMAHSAGMLTLVEAGIEKVRDGETSLEEIIRVIGPQTRHERTCHECRKVIDAKFMFCPFCGSFKQNFCRQCMLPLEENWNICPSCGADKLLNENVQ